MEKYEEFLKMGVIVVAINKDSTTTLKGLCINCSTFFSRAQAFNIKRHLDFCTKSNGTYEENLAKIKVVPYCHSVTASVLFPKNEEFYLTGSPGGGAAPIRTTRSLGVSNFKSQLTRQVNFEAPVSITFSRTQSKGLKKKMRQNLSFDLSREAIRNCYPHTIGTRVSTLKSYTT